MNFDNSLRNVFDRTFRKVLQIILAKDMSSTKPSEENRRKSEPMATGNKAPPHQASTRAERRVLRSKAAIPSLDCCKVTSTEQAQHKDKAEANGSTSSEKSLVAGSPSERTDSAQIGQLRQLLLLHLDLIQQQQEDLQKKDRDLNQLKLEKEQLESRMHRMERRMAMKKRRDLTDGIDSIPEDNDLKPVAPKNRRLSAEQLIRSKRVPAAASVMLTSQMADDTTYDKNLHTELLYLHNKIESCVLENNNEKGRREEQEDVQVPRWKKLEVQPHGKSSSKAARSSASVLNCEIECLDDGVFNKRHSKHESEERRRKRWDVQRFRDRLVHETLEKRLQEREEARLKGVNAHKKHEESTYNSCVSFLPQADDVMEVEVSDTIPVTVFGSPIPLFHTREFECPWFSLDRRELQERKGKVKPGRTRGRRKKTTTYN